MYRSQAPDRLKRKSHVIAFDRTVGGDISAHAAASTGNRITPAAPLAMSGHRERTPPKYLVR
jgi:hypothetical protein